MGELILFGKRSISNSNARVMLAGVPVEVPTNGQQYIDLCKRFLGKEIYEEIVLGIMDVEYYKELCGDKPHIAKIVDCYYSYSSELRPSS